MKTQVVPVEKLLLSRKEAAAVLNLCQRSIDLLIESGSLSAVHVGSRVLVHRDTVAAFAATGHPKGVRG